MTTNRFMAAALALSRRALEIPGAAPFGAVIVKDGEIAGEGLNYARARNDPTSHGEVEAIRDACRRLGTTDLAGCELFTSCEPCPLCVAAMTLAGISKLFYAASLSDSAEAMSALSPALRGRVPIAELRREAGLPPDQRRMPSEQTGRDEAVDALRRWAAARATDG